MRKIATEKLGSTRYDLIITDIIMPGNYEIEFIKSLPKIAKGIPIIMMTGNLSFDLELQSSHPQVIAWMYKPFEFDELLAYVKKAA